MNKPKIRWYLDSKEDNSGKRQIFANINIRYSILDGRGNKRYIPIKLSLGASIKPQDFGTTKTKGSREVYGFDNDIFTRYSRKKTFIRNKMGQFSTAVNVTASYFDLNEINPTPDEFKSRLLIKLKRAEKQQPKSVLEFLREKIKRDEDALAKGIKGAVKDNTIRNYKTVSGFIENYQLATKKTLLFTDLTTEVYWNIFNTCNKIYKGEIQVNNPNRRNVTNINGYSKSTIIKYGEILIANLLVATKDNHITKLDLDDRKSLLLEEVDPIKEIYLSEKEILKVINHKIKDSDLLMAQQFITIATITGLRVSDICELHKLEPKTFQYTTSNETFIGIAVDITKTGKPVVIPLLKHVRDIIKLNNGMFPKFTNPMANKHIKVLCELLDINEKVTLTYNCFNKAEFTEIKEKCKVITTHDCRNSMITNLSNHNIAEEFVENITHPKKGKGSKKSAFQGYFKSGLTGHATRFLKAIEGIDSEVYTYV